MPSKISEIDHKEQQSHISTEEVTTREEEKDKYMKRLQIEDISWKQKSRLTWLKEGDSNTKFFFHKIANLRSRKILYQS